MLLFDDFVNRSNEIYNCKYSYSNLHIDYPYKVYENKEELLKEISYG